MLLPPSSLLILALPFVAGAAGCVLMLRAGRIYTRGGIHAARLPARRGGWLLGAGGSGLALAAAALALGSTALPGPAALPGALFTGAAAAIGMLGGLSGKPRPAGGVATACYVAGAACLLAAA